MKIGKDTRILIFIGKVGWIIFKWPYTDKFRPILKKVLFGGEGFSYKCDQIIDYPEPLRSFKKYPLLNRNINCLRPLTSQCKNYRALILAYKNSNYSPS